MPTLNLAEIDIYYEMTGKGEPLLFIHGLGSSTRDWEHQVEFFADRYQVIAFDVRGHGQTSQPPGPYSVAQFAEDTAKLLDALEVGPAHVVGLSMGGMIAFQLAVSYPEKVRSMTVVNSGPAFLINSFKIRMLVWQRFLLLRVFGMRKIGKVLSERLFPMEQHKALRAQFVERWAENDVKPYRAAMRAIVGWSVLDYIEDIQCPTLALASDEDYTPVAAKQAYVERMPNAELVVVKNARHVLPIERPKAFNSAVASFLKAQE